MYDYQSTVCNAVSDVVVVDLFLYVGVLEVEISSHDGVLSELDWSLGLSGVEAIS